jgi:crotonobetainyl-CoA:carnitine CoA-transferase CaiB-like acyl-CoA transferase
VLTRGQVASDPQVVHNGLIEVLDQPGFGQVRQPRPAARFERTPASIGGPAPRIGEHTDRILTELGFSENDIEALKATGAARSAASNPGKEN